MLNVSSAQLRQAADIQDRIEALQKELSTILGSPSPSISTSDTASKPRKRRKISAAGRARIAEAQRKRWAALKSRKS